MDVSFSELRELVTDSEAWSAAIPGVAKSWTWLSDWTELNWSPVAYWAPTNLGSSSFRVLSFCLCSWGSQGKNTEVVCLSLPQWTIFCQNSPPWPVCLGWPYKAWLSFIELDKVLVCVIRLASCLLLFQSVCCYIYTFHVFLMHSSLTRHLGWFYTLAIVKGAVMNMAV